MGIPFIGNVRARRLTSLDKAIISFQTFIETLRRVGFSMAGINKEGIYTVAEHYASNIIEHTGESETDPWAWRMRSIKECDDIFYSKVFLNKGGYITGEWYPYFFVIRRKHMDFEQMYEAGQFSYESKQVYQLVKAQPHIALHEITSAISTDKSAKAKIEAAITQLQMKLFVTISGEKYKISKEGNPYGWPVTTFALVEDFVSPKILKATESIKIEEASLKMMSRSKELNPNATDKMIKRFLGI